MRIVEEITFVKKKISDTEAKIDDCDEAIKNAKEYGNERELERLEQKWDKLMAYLVDLERLEQKWDKSTK